MQETREISLQLSENSPRPLTNNQHIIALSSNCHSQEFNIEILKIQFSIAKNGGTGKQILPILQVS